MHDCPPKPDVLQLQDSIVEMAKDLLMLDTGALLAYEETRSHGTPKEQAFHNMVVAFDAAKQCAEDFRRAHVDESKVDLRAAMEMQVAERLAEIDEEERARRRAS